MPPPSAVTTLCRFCIMSLYLSSISFSLFKSNRKILVTTLSQYHSFYLATIQVKYSHNLKLQVSLLLVCNHDLELKWKCRETERRKSIPIALLPLSQIIGIVQLCLFGTMLSYTVLRKKHETLIYYYSISRP